MIPEVFKYFSPYMVVPFFLCILGIIKMNWPGRIFLIPIIFFYSALAMPNTCCVNSCRQFQSEAKQVLGEIAKAEASYFSEYEVYTDNFQKLSLNVMDGRIYQYSVELSDDNRSYTAFANSKFPGIQGCGKADDVWTINENIELVNEKRGCMGAPCAEDPCLFHSSCLERRQEQENREESFFWAPLVLSIFLVLVSFGYDARKAKSPSK